MKSALTAAIACCLTVAAYAPSHAQQTPPPATGVTLPTVVVPVAPAPQAATPPKPKAPAAKLEPSPAPQPLARTSARRPSSAPASSAAPAAVAPPPLDAPTSDVVRVSPVAGSEIAIDKLPTGVGTVSAADQQRYGAPSATEALQRRVPGVILNDTLGSPLAADLQFRGFSASPLNGTPQGLAVYQNGVRINEVFGDAVNWDLVPAFAIRDITVIGANPIYGLNALGGAVGIVMQDGFGYQGLEADARIGSFGRRHATVQGGMRNGGLATYVAADALNDSGWRDHSASQARRAYADIGAKGSALELHLNYTGARNLFGASGPTPVELLAQRRASVFTTPQSFDNRTSMLNLNGTATLSDTLKLSGLVYWRGFSQRRPDGNISAIAACEAPGDPAFLCVDDNGAPERVRDRFGNDIPSSVLAGGLAGSNDRTSVDARTIGGSLQATSKAPLAGLGNQLVAGASIDQGRASVTSASELGVLDPNTLTVRGLGIILGGDEFAPRALSVRTGYYGAFVSNTLDLTDRLSWTIGGRFNLATIELKDRLGDDLNGSHRYQRFNPATGLTYKLMPGLSLYGGYAEANRAPTPAELACADPTRPCLLENFLVSDPPLKQVVSRTVEAGLRGKLGAATATQRLDWSLGAFHAVNTDDIINVASATQGRGYFLNAGRTQRQGVEAMLNLRAGPWTAYAGYALVDATYRDALTLSSPHNPAADGEGHIHVTKGDRLPSVPRHRFKAGVDYALTQHWRVGADLVAASSQFFRGDEGNDARPLAGYWVVNLKTAYDVSKMLQVYGVVENAFDRRYATSGAFYDTGPLHDARGLSDPRTITPAAPLAAYGGVKLRF